MRRVLVEAARKKGRGKRGGGRRRVPLDEAALAVDMDSDDLLDLDDALAALEQIDKSAADVVRLRCFAGLSMEDAAGTLGLAERSAYRSWAFGRAWLYRRLQGGEPPVEE